MEIELSLLIRNAVTLFLPMLLLIVIATYILARASNLKAAKLFASFALFTAFAYGAEIVRQMLPVEYSYIIQAIFITFLLNVGLALFSHMLYEMIRPYVKHKLQKLLVVAYLLPFVILVAALIHFYRAGTPDYVTINGWMYAVEDQNLLSSIFTGAFYGISIALLVFGYLSSHTNELKRFYVVTAVLVTMLTMAVSAFQLEQFAFDYFIPPTPSLLLNAMLAAMFVLLMHVVDFIPSTSKKYKALMHASPTAIIQLNEKLQIVEKNNVAKMLYNLEEGAAFKNYFKFATNERQYNELFHTLNSEGTIKGYELNFVTEDGQQYILVDGICKRIGQEKTYYLMLHEVTEEFKYRKQNEYYANHDSLTDIPNRIYFERQVKAALYNIKPSCESAFILMDLNFFKQINDQFGHQVGDEVLKYTAKLLQESFPQPHILARLGGDEFVVFIECIQSKAQIEQMIQSVRTHFKNNYFQKDDIAFEIVPSFGAAFSIGKVNDCEKLYQQADAKMYEDKLKIESVFNQMSSI